jgi:hypothetical protein
MIVDENLPPKWRELDRLIELLAVDDFAVEELQDAVTEAIMEAETLAVVQHSSMILDMILVGGDFQMARDRWERTKSGGPPD